MSVDHTNEPVKDYLLGTMSDEERLRLEEKYFNDDELFEEMEIAEGELIDAYVNGRLADRDLARFEDNLSNSARLSERVEFARLLAHSSRTQKRVFASEDSWWTRLMAGNVAPGRGLRWALAAGSLVLVLGGAAFFYESFRLRQESQLLASERAHLEAQQRALTEELNKRNSELNTLAEVRAANEKLLEQLEAATKEGPAEAGRNNVPFAFFLSPGTFRGAGNANLVLVSSKRPNIRLVLELESDEYSSYAAVIKSVDGNDVWSQSELKSVTRRSGKVINLTVPTPRLAKGVYAIELSGQTTSQTLERVSSYSFRVE